MKFLIKEKSFYSDLFSLTLPIMLQQLLRISVDTVNSIMLGGIDQLQMSAVSQASQIFFVFYTVCNGLAVGACVLIAQYWGQRNVNAIRTILSTGLRYAAVFGLAVSVLVMVTPTTFMRIYSSDPALIELGAGYLRVVALMYMPCALSVMLFAACRGVEQVRIILATNVVSYTVNIFLDYCLLFGKFGFPKLGILGIAIGTVTARLVELVICSIFVLKFESHIGFRFRHLKLWDKQINRDFIKVASPIAAHEVIWSVGTSASSAITGQLGTSVVAGFNVADVLYQLTAAIGNGFLNACSVVIGKTIGGGNIEKVKRQAKTMMLMSVFGGVMIGLVLIAARGPFLSLYNLQPDAVSYAKQFMLVLGCIWPFSALEMVAMIGILRAGGDGKTGFYSDIVIMWIICIPLAALAAFALHLPPVQIILILKMTIVLEAIVGSIRVLSMRWIRDLTRH